MKMTSRLLSIVLISGTIFAGKYNSEFMNKSHEIVLKNYGPEINRLMTTKYVDQLNKKAVINKYNDVLVKKGSLKGGGPITACVLQWMTRATLYGGMAAATGAAAVAAAPAVTAATLGAPVVATLGATGVTAVGNAAVVGMGTVVANTVLGTAMAATGPGMVAAAIGTSATATAAATTGTTLALVGANGCLATVVTGVETASWAAFAFGMSLPLP